MATGLTAPRTVVSTRLVYCVAHLAQAMAGAADSVASAAGCGLNNVAPLTWAEVFMGDQTAKATAKARLVPMIEVSILFFIFFFFFCLAKVLFAVLDCLRERR